MHGLKGPQPPAFRPTLSNRIDALKEAVDRLFEVSHRIKGQLSVLDVEFKEEPHFSPILSQVGVSSISDLEYVVEKLHQLHEILNSLSDTLSETL